MAPSPISPLSEDQLNRVVAGVREQMGAVGLKRDVVKWILEIALAVIVAWGTVNTRISVLEARFDDMRVSIADIQKDMKTLLQRGNDR